jgi:DNA-binding NarL/FixJ family response regulator
MTRISVILADDHPAVLAGIRGALEEAPDIEVLGCAGRGDEALHLIETLNPQVALLDYRLPGLDGPAVVLSAYASDAYVHSMLTAGASGYLLKDEALEVVVEAVRAVAAGEVWFSSSVEKQARSWAGCRSPQPPGVANLTPREQEVLRLVAQGWSNARIADEFKIVEGTVKQHVCSIYAKLNVHSRAEAVAWAWQQELMER